MRVLETCEANAQDAQVGNPTCKDPVDLRPAILFAMFMEVL